jgi:hypothetical protein
MLGDELFVCTSNGQTGRTSFPPPIPSYRTQQERVSREDTLKPAREFFGQ